MELMAATLVSLSYDYKSNLTSYLLPVILNSTEQTGRGENAMTIS
jgi:hypothetical protein